MSGALAGAVPCGHHAPCHVRPLEPVNSVPPEGNYISKNSLIEVNRTIYEQQIVEHQQVLGFRNPSEPT